MACSCVQIIDPMLTKFASDMILFWLNVYSQKMSLNYLNQNLFRSTNPLLVVSIISWKSYDVDKINVKIVLGIFNNLVYYQTSRSLEIFPLLTRFYNTQGEPPLHASRAYPSPTRCANLSSSPSTVAAPKTLHWKATVLEWLKSNCGRTFMPAPSNVYLINYAKSLLSV